MGTDNRIVKAWGRGRGRLEEIDGEKRCITFNNKYFFN